VNVITRYCGVRPPTKARQNNSSCTVKVDITYIHTYIHTYIRMDNVHALLLAAGNGNIAKVTKLMSQAKLDVNVCDEVKIVCVCVCMCVYVCVCVCMCVVCVYLCLDVMR